MISSWIIGFWVAGGLMYIIGLIYISSYQTRRKNPPTHSREKMGKAVPGLTVIVPMRNENVGLQPRMAHWRKWAEANPNVNFVFIDDQSSDGTLTELENTSFSAGTRVISGIGTGKIGCWQAALQNAPISDYYLLMDADVAPNIVSLTPLLCDMASQNADLAMLPLGICASNFRSTFEALDFVGLHGVGQRLLSRGYPILFSSAYTLVCGSLLRSFLHWVSSETGHRNAAGPDARWMAYLSEHAYETYMFSERQAANNSDGFYAEPVYGLMPAQAGFRTWLEQRARWASNALGAPRSESIWIQAAVIFGVLCAHLSVFAIPFAPVWAPLWLLKAFAEWRFFRTFPSVVSPRVPLLPFFVHSALFALLLPIAASYSLLLAGRRNESRWR